MRILYHSAFKDEELCAGSTYRTVPCRATLKLQRENDESPYDLIYNGTVIDPTVTEIECNEQAELIVRQDGNRYLYVVKPSVQPLSPKNANAYDEFYYEYDSKKTDEIRSIQDGSVKLYAVDQSTEVHDWTGLFDQIEAALPAFKAISDKPKSHLKAVNEVRPIETVKRIGYESIPYLASHSEDWLARTASGLKPARLFSRVEDDEYQIYENRVVKTLIDLILSFLRKTEKQLRDQRDQLRGIIDSNVQFGSFGFDASFQKAVSEIMITDEKGDDYRFRCFDLVDKLQKRAYMLLKKYRALRELRLYRYLKKAKPVANPLNETNILTMDKHYSVVFKLWHTIHYVIAPKLDEDEYSVAFDDTQENYTQFCMLLCGYAAHTLNFDLKEDGHYYREADSVDLTIERHTNGSFSVVLEDKERRNLITPDGADVPIEAGSEYGRFSYDGRCLYWPNDVSENEIDAFCALFKPKEIHGKELYEGKKKYQALKKLIDDRNRSYQQPMKTSFCIFPSPVELDNDTRNGYRQVMFEIGTKLREELGTEQVIIALPLCNEPEQKLVSYAKGTEENIMFLPLTMFDINSFRRLQNVLYRHILLLEKNNCLSCGRPLRYLGDNQSVCDYCSGLMITKTQCANPHCKCNYHYLSYDISADTVLKMQAVKEDNFFHWDSLYQYKDIVPMRFDGGRVRPVCPRCKN